MENKKGLLFEATLARSWVASNINLVRMKITDTGEEKPCDERIDFDDYRVFNELKSTKNNAFKISELKKHQIRNLYSWHNKFKNSISTISIEFTTLNIAYMIDIISLINLCRTEKLNKITSNDIEKTLHYKIEKKENLYSIDYNILDYYKKIKGAG